MKYGITGHRLLGDTHAQEEIRKRLDELLHERARPDDEVWSGMAIGADQMFAKLALSMGLHLHAVVACQGYDTTFAPGDELRGYQTLLARASMVTVLDYPEPSEAAFEASGQWIVDHCDVLVAVWNGMPAKGRGGTGDIVAYARSRGVAVIVVPVA